MDNIVHVFAVFYLILCLVIKMHCLNTMSFKHLKHFINFILHYGRVVLIYYDIAGFQISLLDPSRL